MGITRELTHQVAEHLARGKSILLLGPRQTGKTTLTETFKAQHTLNLLTSRLRLRYEQDPDLFYSEIEAIAKDHPFPLIIIDEVQLVPSLLDMVQMLVDKKIAQFILTGSSARKLKHAGRINLLPGRVVVLYLDPLTFAESQALNVSIENRLIFGELPAIMQESNPSYQETDLQSYVETYLEEEVRRESLVHHLASFSRFLELAAAQSGEIINFSKLSKEIGVTHTTIAAYYQILEDCLITRRIDPYIETKTRRKLTQSPKYLFFDLGVRRVAAREGYPLPTTILGRLFEQWVGLALIKQMHLQEPRTQLYFWRDRNGIEVDWILKRHDELLPIEVKWTDHPSNKDTRHLRIFMEEHQLKQGYVICRTPQKFEHDGVVFLPWQNLTEIFKLNPLASF